MRRFLALFLVLAQVAQAAPTGKLLTYNGDRSIITNATTAHRQDYYSVARHNRITHSWLNRLGVNYTDVKPINMRPEFGRTGEFVWNQGKGGARAEAFNAVLWISPRIGSTTWNSNSTAGPGVNAAGRPDSLVNSARLVVNGINGLQVPNLFLMSDAGSHEAGSVTMQASCCTTGVTSGTYPDEFGNGLMHSPGSDMGWYTGGLYNGMPPLGVTPNGGIRPLLVTHNFARLSYPAGTAAAWWDSMPADHSSLANGPVWLLPFAHISGSKPLIMAYADGAGAPAGDSLSDVTGEPGPIAEVDPSVILFALATLDSFANHTLFDKDKLPIKVAVTVDCANCYTGNRAGPGIVPSDTANYYSSLDSLAWLNQQPGVKVKLTVGWNVAGVSGAADSANPILLAKYRAIGGTRFTPQSWAGILSLTYRRAAAGVGDVFGFADPRAFVGDFDQAAGTADTSVAQQLRWAKRLLRQQGIDASEISRTICAPLDDWAPVNKNAGSLDSALYAFRLAGFTTVRNDGRYFQSMPRMFNNTSMANATYRGVSNGVFGYTDKQGRYRDAGGGTVNILNHQGDEIFGAKFQHAVEDSSNAFGFALDYTGSMNYRIWAGLSQDIDAGNYDMNGSGAIYPAFANPAYYGTHKDQVLSHMNSTKWPRRAYIYKINAADLSGVTGGYEVNPARNAWPVIKGLKNAFDAINKANGRTVITFAHPEDIAP